METHGRTLTLDQRPAQLTHENKSIRRWKSLNISFDEEFVKLLMKE